MFRPHEEIIKNLNEWTDHKIGVCDVCGCASPMFQDTVWNIGKVRGLEDQWLCLSCLKWTAASIAEGRKNE